VTIKEFTEETMDNFVALMKKQSKENTRDKLDLEVLRDLGKSMSMQVQALLDYQLSTLNIVELYSNFTEDDKFDSSEKDEKKPDGFVYIAKQLNEKNIYKIGITKDIKKRLNSFTTGNAFVEMIASRRFNNYKMVEKEIHKKMSKNRYKNEWFYIDCKELSILIDMYGFNYHIAD